MVKFSVLLLIALIFASVNTAEARPPQIGGPGDDEQILIGTTGSDWIIQKGGTGDDSKSVRGGGGNLIVKKIEHIKYVIR